MIESFVPSRFAPIKSIFDYVSSLGESFVCPEFSKVLSPCQLQALATYIRQVLQTASDIYGHQAIELYVRNTAEGELHEILKESLRDALKFLNVELDEEVTAQVILPGLIASL
jgi:hypothetical protein